MLTENYLVGICTTGSRSTIDEFLTRFKPVLDKYPNNVRVVIGLNGDGEYLPPKWDQVGIVREPRRGIAYARNRVIQERRDDENLIFIDDDEYPDSNWFENLIASHTLYPDCLIAGPVREVDESGKVIFDSKIRPIDNIPDGALRPLAATNNLLIPSSTFASGLVYLDLYFNHGGSDTDLTMRLRRRGIQIRWAANAIMFELEDTERNDPDWSYRRDCRNAAIYPIAIKRNETLLYFLAYSLKKFGQYSLYFFLRFLSESNRKTFVRHQISVKSLLRGRQAN